MMKNKLILIGGGGHCRSCIDVIESEGKFKIVGIIDIKEKIGENVLGYNIIGCDEDLPYLLKNYKNFFVSIGQISSPEIRLVIFEKLKENGAELPIIISPFSHVSKHAKLGNGTIIMHGAVVNAGSRIGQNCIINTGAVIEHDTIIGDHCHISTNSIINGGSKIGESTFIGSGCVLKEYIEINRGVIIGAGSVVLNSITESGIFYGKPVKRQESNG